MTRKAWWSVASGWQYRVYLEDEIVGGWAPTRDDAKRRARRAVQ